MHTPHRTLQTFVPVLALALTLLFSITGTLKPWTVWHWLDIAAEGGTAVLAGYWAHLVIGSRPGGRVTQWLAGGLTLVMLGTWADCLDEFFVKDAAIVSLKWIESVLTSLGMLAVTRGMLLWREEQVALTAHMSKRERLFRDHRELDRTTQVASSDYLLRQITLEQARNPLAPCALVLIDLCSLHQIERSNGQAEADRVLQAVAHQLLLNLRHRDLLCRYAGHRFVVLMPNTSLADSQRMGGQLCAMVETMRFHALQGDVRVKINARMACAVANIQAQTILTTLNAVVEDLDAPTPLPLPQAS